jgi:hypothetical protein
MYQIAIVITAYNRSESLHNILTSLSKLIVNQNVDLIIGIDNKGTDEVIKVANQYEWKYGSKKVVIHEEKKGLVKHFIWAGDQTIDYDNIIFLEDDLLVSPFLIHSAIQIIDFYSEDSKVAAASLYNPVICEMTGEKFYQIEDGFDFYFLQQPYWGNIWFKKQWENFKLFLDSYIEKKDLLPESIANWENSFKKIYIQYLVEQKKYVITPRVSLVTNNGVAGLHSGVGQSHMQSNLLMKKQEYRLCKIEESFSIYDAFMEIDANIIKSFCPHLNTYNFTVDIKGLKRNYNKPYVLTTKKVKDKLHQYTSLMKPTELGVILNQKGNAEIKLCKKEDVIESRLYYLARRYNDITKNYWVGINAGLLISLITVKRINTIIISKFKSFWL